MNSSLAPDNETTRSRFKFFLENDGYCTPPGRATCALASARAERLLVQDTSIRFQWLPELMAWEGKPEHWKDGDSLWYCVLETRCKSCNQWRVRESLGMIHFKTAYPFSDNYTRIVEKNLYLEYMEEKT